jgi:hypothetical protein
MKIVEARKIYSVQMEKYWDQKMSLAKKKKELEEKGKIDPNSKEQFLKEAVTLELSYNVVSEKCEEYHNFMEQVMEIRSGLYNAEIGRQQGDVMSEQARDIAKIMEVARRISKGGKVPPADEKKLMEYSMVMYMSAKNAAMMNEMKEKKQYDSLWEEEKSSGMNPDPNEIADNAELAIDAPEVVEVADVMASAGGSNNGLK